MMDDASIQKDIDDALRALLGGPRSLRFSPRLLCEGLCAFSGRLAALTKRPTDHALAYFEGAYERAAVVELRQGTDRCEGGSPADVSAFLVIGLVPPAGQKRPTHLVLGSVLSLLAQVSRAAGIARWEVRRWFEKSYASVRSSEVDAFQRAASARSPN